MIYYSASVNGFYDPAIHIDIPADAVGITASGHADLLAAQALGQVIRPGEDGRPEAADPTFSEEQLATAARGRRDALLAACDWTQLPDSPLDSSTQAAWATYRQALRDVSAQPAFPASVDWPTAPES